MKKKWSEVASNVIIVITIIAMYAWLVICTVDIIKTVVPFLQFNGLDRHYNKNIPEYLKEVTMSYIFVNILLITLTTTILRLLKNKSYKILNIFIIAKSLIVVGALFIFDLYVLITNLFFISNVADLFEPLGVFVFGIICIILITSFSEAIPIWIYGGISGEMSKYEQAKQAKLRNLA